MKRPAKLFSVAALAVALGGVFISTEHASAQGGQGGPTVTIANPLPLPVRAVDSEYQGVRASGSCTITLPTTGCSADLFTVPAGKQLVVEYFSALANVSAAGATVRVALDDSTVFHYLPMLPPAAAGPNQGGITSGGGPMRLYLAAGEKVRGSALRSGDAGTTSMLFSMAGYLVDVSPN